MNLGEKMPYARTSVRSISRHIDEDASVRKALLLNLIEFIQEESEWIDQEVQSKIDSALTPVVEPEPEPEPEPEGE